MNLAHDCIMLRSKMVCTGLTDRCRDEDNCPFYQSLEMAKESQNKWRKRLKSLPFEKQEQIARKYYNGKFIWNDKRYYTE